MKRLAIVLAAAAAMAAPVPTAPAWAVPAWAPAWAAAAEKDAGEAPPPAEKAPAPAASATQKDAASPETSPPAGAPGAGEPSGDAVAGGDPAASPKPEMPAELKKEIERERLDEARIAALREAAVAHPDEARYHVELLTALIDLERIDEAILGGEEIVERFPKSAEAFVEFGRALARDGSFDLAKLQLQRAIALDASNAAAHAWNGRIELARGDRRSAEASLRKSLALDPGRNDARYALATLLEGAGKYAEAIAVLESAPRSEGGASKPAGARAELRGRWSLLRELEKRAPYQLPSGFTSTAVPMKRVRGLPPLVSVKLGDKVETLFVVDTGSDEVVLTAASARALGLPEKGSETLKDSKGREYPTPAYVVLDRIDLGTLTVKRVPARVAPTLRYPVAQIGGILGRDFLRRFRPVLDYPSKMLTLARAEGPPLQGTPFDIMGSILIEGMNGDHQLGKFMVDTSSYTPGALDVQLVAAETGLTVFDEKVTQLPDGPYMFKFTMPRLTLAGVEFRNFPATAVDLRQPSRQIGVKLRGILGHSLLRDCRLEIDFQNQRLSLKRRPAPAPGDPAAAPADPAEAAADPAAGDVLP